MVTNFKGKIVKPKTVTVRIEDPSTACVVSNISGLINANQEYDFTGIEVVEVAFPIYPFLISHAGHYLIDVLIDREKIGSRNVAVSSATVQGLPPPLGLPPQKP